VGLSVFLTDLYVVSGDSVSSFSTPQPLVCDNNGGGFIMLILCIVFQFLCRAGCFYTVTFCDTAGFTTARVLDG